MNTVQFDPNSIIGTLTPIGEIISVPSWHPEQNMWRALVAVTPSGPLVLAEFSLTIDGQTNE